MKNKFNFVLTYKNKTKQKKPKNPTQFLGRRQAYEYQTKYFFPSCRNSQSFI